MVRHKTRWLLVKVEPTSEVVAMKRRIPSASSSSTITDSSFFPTQKEFLVRLRRTLTWCFGLMGDVAAMSLQIRFFDAAKTRLVLLRGLRDHCGMIRSALTLMLTQKKQIMLGERDDSLTAQKEWMSTILSVHGSTRTAKMGTLHVLKSIYRVRIAAIQKERKKNDCTAFLKEREKELGQELQERLITIQSLD